MALNPDHEFYIAFVDATETTFGAEHHREDAKVFSMKMEHVEGQLPTCTLEMRNPHVGLLAAGHPTWIWIALRLDVTVTPIFFGRLVGMPDSILDQVITVQYVARPFDYIRLKQLYAETLKALPYYDPVFIAPERRDDPDGILDGYSAFWHVDRTTHEVSVSDVNFGEDGTEAFAVNEVPYDSVQVSFEQPPLTHISVTADVSWTQAATGFLNIGKRTFITYTGDGLIGDWPKPLTDLGGGWTAAYSVAADTYNVGSAPVLTFNYSWQNEERHHTNGDTMSLTINGSLPYLPGGYQSRDIKVTLQNGFIDANAEDEEGDPAPINIPESANIETAYVPKWTIGTSLILRYDAARQRTEQIRFVLSSDLQPIVTDAADKPDYETLTLQGVDVSQPVVQLLNWDSISGTVVALGTLVFPSAGATPQTVQIATTAGTAGTVEPAFSPVAGDTTADGSVVWTSLGQAGVPDMSGDWPAGATVGAGTIILPRTPRSILYDWLIEPGQIQHPKQGVSVNEGTIILTASGSYQVCTQSGVTEPDETPTFSFTWGAVTTDGTVEWTSLNQFLPTGIVYFVCTTAGITGLVEPAFGNPGIYAVGSTVTDGTAVWTSIGAADVPIGGAPGNTPSSSYFATDRGNQSIQYAINVARAHLALRARAVRVAWDCRIERALALSCRKNASLDDPRIPAGTAGGKVIGYTIEADGDRKELKGTVTIGCTIGMDNVVTPVAGDPGYVDATYVAAGYQAYIGALLTTGYADVGYSPPAPPVDGTTLTFPLQKDAVVLKEVVHGVLADQVDAITTGLQTAYELANTTELPPTNFDDALAQYLANQDTSKASVTELLQREPIWYELQLTNLTGGPYANSIAITTTPLVLPRTIDLEAATSA